MLLDQPLRLLSTSTNELRIWDISAVLHAGSEVDQVDQEVHVPCLLCAVAVWDGVGVGGWRLGFGVGDGWGWGFLGFVGSPDLGGAN